MRSKKKEKKIYIYKLFVTIIFALAIVFVLNTAQNYIRNEITGKTNLVINNGNVTKSIKNDVIVEDDVVVFIPFQERFDFIQPRHVIPLKVF